ncbi:MAG: hypothetical protein GTO02_03940 [Candidatus Dadabacteria bacterium]|nr:hypothetical protein [Candidatus Dadabacteria bacterium]NIQ13577.1 hypothetical protein [Candidatus Dadabacteria bacterium]
MEKVANFLSKNELDLSILSNKYFLIVLIYLNKENKPVKINEISESLNISSKKLNQYIDYLIRIGYVEKTNKLDRSKKPPFINTFYKINDEKFNNLLNVFRSLLKILNLN